MKKLRKKIKINAALVVTLTWLSLLMAGVNFHQTIAGMNYSSSENNNNHYVSILKTYSDEVELNSAPEYSKKVIEMKWEYKTKFNKVLWDRLSKVSNSKLEIVYDRIEEKLEEIKSSETIDKERKDKIIAQLLALREIIAQEIENEELSIDIDLEEILKL